MVAVAAAHVITPTQTLSPGVVDIDESSGAIVDIASTRGPVPDLVLAPGFVDIQVNGIDDVDVAHAAGDDWDALDELLDRPRHHVVVPDARHRAAGVLRPTNRIASPTRRTRHATCPSIIGAHLEGPFLGGAPGAHRRELIIEPDLDWIASLPDVVVLTTLAPEARNAVDAIKVFRDRGVVVSLGHSTATAAQSGDAVDAGARSVTHLFNGMGALHHREPGPPRHRAHRRPPRRRRSSPTSSTCTLPRSDSRSPAKPRSDGARHRCRRLEARSRRRHASAGGRWCAPPRRRHARRQRPHDGPCGRERREPVRRQPRAAIRVGIDDARRPPGTRRPRRDRGREACRPRRPRSRPSVCRDVDRRHSRSRLTGCGGPRLTAYGGPMDIVSPLFIESFNMRQAPGPRPASTSPARSSRWPRRRRSPSRSSRTSSCSCAAAPDEPGNGILEVVLQARRRAGRSQRVSRSQVEPGQVHLPPGAGRARVRRATARSTRTAGSAMARSPWSPSPCSRRSEDRAGCRSPPRCPSTRCATHAIGEVVGDVLDQLGSRRRSRRPRRRLRHRAPRRRRSRTWRRPCGRCCTRAR